MSDISVIAAIYRNLAFLIGILIRDCQSLVLKNEVKQENYEMFGLNPLRVTIYFLSIMISGLFFTNISLAKPDTGVGTSQKWAVMNGFRSAHFGMKDTVNSIMR